MSLDQELQRHYRLTFCAGSPITRSQSKKVTTRTPRQRAKGSKKSRNERQNPDEFLTGLALDTDVDVTPLFRFADDDFDVSHTIYVVFDLEQLDFRKKGII
jgi:hypothetical protein